MALLDVKGQPFDLNATLECGQGHRWVRVLSNPGWYESVLGDQVVRISQPGGPNKPVQYVCPNPVPMQGLLQQQFRFGDNVNAIYAALGTPDLQMAALIKQYPGLRVMSVEPWECLVFFMLFEGGISTIEVVMNRMELLANVLGKPIGTFPGGRRPRHAFPTPGAFAAAGGALPRLITGTPVNVPAKLIATAKAVAAGDINPPALRLLRYPVVNRSLKDVWPHGPKSRDCVALFSLDQLGAFPVDGHIRKSWANQYPGSPPATGARGRAKFLSYAGYASQFLFIDDLLKGKRATGANLATVP